MTFKPDKSKKQGLVIPMAAVIGFVIFLFVSGLLAAIVYPALLEDALLDGRAKNRYNAMNVRVAIQAYESDYGEVPNPNGATFKLGGDLVLGIPPGSDPSSPASGHFKFVSGLMWKYERV